MTRLPKTFKTFRGRHHEVFTAYEALGVATADDGPLDGRTRELVRLGMAAAAGSEGSVLSHAYRALEAGASSAEVEHALLLGITTLGFPRTMAALSWVEQALGRRPRRRRGR